MNIHPLDWENKGREQDNQGQTPSHGRSNLIQLTELFFDQPYIQKFCHFDACIIFSMKDALNKVLIFSNIVSIIV